MKNLEPDLKTGVIPISQAAAHLAALIKQATATGRPIAITQKGYPSGVILSVPVFTALRELAERVAAEEEPVPTAFVRHVLPLPTPLQCPVESVVDYPDERLVQVRFRYIDSEYIVELPYRLDSGGRGYTWAGADLPGPSVWSETEAARPLVDTEFDAFRAWCQVADAELAE